MTWAPRAALIGGVAAGIGLIAVVVGSTPPPAEATPTGPAAAPVRKLAGRASGLSRAAYLDGIMRRNVFDVATLEGWNPGTGATGAAASLDVALLGTVVADDPRLSTAFVRHDGDGSVRFYGWGDVVFGHRVDRIEPRTVTLTAPDGTQTVLHTTGEASALTPSQGASDRGEPPGERADENHLEVSGSVFADLDLEALVSEGEMKQYRDRDGRVAGLRVRDVGPGSLADHLGLESGDVLMGIEGQSFDDLGAAANQIQQLQGRERFCAQVRRAGTPTLMCYDVQ